MKKICIIGLGLIGSSISRGLKKLGTYTVVGYDNNTDYLSQANDLNFCHNVFDNIKDSVDGADIIVFATPVSTYKEILLSIKGSLKSGAIITDVGSVKQKVVDDLIDIIPDGINFVPAHPISGTEKSGPKAGYAELFENRFCVICPNDKSTNESIETVKKIWTDLGSKVDIIDPVYHDKALAITSHIPHLMAYTLVGMAQNMEQKDLSSKELIKYSAGGFRDATRVAGSDPTMWRDVFISNKVEMEKVIDLFIADLETMKDAINNENGQFIFDWLSKTREIHKQVVAAGQSEYTDPHDEKEFSSLSPYNQD